VKWQVLLALAIGGRVCVYSNIRCDVLYGRAFALLGATSDGIPEAPPIRRC